MTYLNESHMPGPSDEARALQLRQYAAYDAMYEALNAVRRENPSLDYQAAYQQPAVLATKQAYEETVAALQALLGAEAHCNLVDCDLWSAFSDFYKDKNGFRPRGIHFTRDAVHKRLTAPV